MNPYSVMEIPFGSEAMKRLEAAMELCPALNVTFEAETTGPWAGGSAPRASITWMSVCDKVLVSPGLPVPKTSC